MDEFEPVSGGGDMDHAHGAGGELIIAWRYEHDGHHGFECHWKMRKAGGGSAQTKRPAQRRSKVKTYAAKEKCAYGSFSSLGFSELA